MAAGCAASAVFYLAAGRRRGVMTRPVIASRRSAHNVQTT
jgi:hypothetical protein